MVSESLFLSYVEDLLAGRRRACRATVEALVARGTPVRTLFVELFTASLHEVGRRWAAGQVSVAQEHVATAVTEELLALVFPAALAAAPRPKVQRRALVACTPGELHQVGARIVADTLELAGWDTDFLGANTPVVEVITLARQRSSRAVLLSASLLESVPAALEAAARVHQAMPDAAVVIGGGAFACQLPTALVVPPGVRLLVDLPALEAALPALAT